MDVTVVIPSYNRADLLPVTLDAVLAQTLPPRQVIVPRCDGVGGWALRT